jgi:hypothetical protein
MSRSRESLITELSCTSTPVREPGRTHGQALLCLLAGAIIAILAMALWSPITTVRWQALAASVQFLLEFLIGFGAIVLSILMAFRTAIPSIAPITRRIGAPLLLVLLWVLCIGIGIWHAALEPTMVGKRAHCWAEALVAGLPLLIIGGLAIRRLWPLHGMWTGMLLGLASGGTVALIMQFICMYDPVHALLLHLAPGLALGVIGALAGRFLLRPGARIR